MKKAVLLVLLTISFSVGFLSAQEFYLNPNISVSRINLDAASLVRQLAYQIVAGENQEKFLVAGPIKTNSRELYQWHVVFSHRGKRYSIYYQWDIVSRANYWNYNFLRISVRPEGTHGYDDLVSYKDYHLNGSWDECLVGRSIYLAELCDGYAQDTIYQKNFLDTIKEALGFFK